MSNYNPTPIETADIILPSEIANLTEKLAENAHDVWALSRIKEGWTYGEKRDDAAKTHPCLVPYNDLPESEKDYDRDTAMQTIKLIIKLGYNITAV